MQGHPGKKGWKGDRSHHRGTPTSTVLDIGRHTAGEHWRRCHLAGVRHPPVQLEVLPPPRVWEPSWWAVDPPDVDLPPRHLAREAVASAVAPLRRVGVHNQPVVRQIHHLERGGAGE
jgi:nucleotide-binding universal stress UspA family protein